MTIKNIYLLECTLRTLFFSLLARWYIFYPLDMLYIFCCSKFLPELLQRVGGLGDKPAADLLEDESVKRYILRKEMHVFLYIR
jgi:hypothetical protein